MELAESNQQTSSKKAKKHKETSTPQSENISIGLSNDQLQSSENGELESKPKRPKSKKQKATEETTDADEDERMVDEDDPKHKKMLERREKSLKKAEKLARKASKQSTEEHEEEPAAKEPAELHDLVPLPQPEPVPEAPIQSITSALPPWLASPIRISPNTSAPFAAVGVREDVAEALHKKGFEVAFAVQAAVLPLLLPGDSQGPGDILVSAATGSGKTLAYVLPMIEDISQNQTTKLRGLIVVPTRELVSQAREVAEICASAFGVGSRKRVKTGTAVGNETLKVEQTALMDQELYYDPEGYRKQQTRLNAKWESSDGESDMEAEVLCDDEAVSNLPDHIIKPAFKVDILICTPGRLVEHLKNTAGFSLEHLSWLVADEADKLLDQSFQQWLDFVLPSVQDTSQARRNRLRKVILSATMTRDIGQLNSLKLYRPQLVLLEGSCQEDGFRTAEASQALFLPALLLESGIKVDDESIKPLYLVEILKRENIICSSRKGTSASARGDDSSSDDDSSDVSSDSDSASDQSSRDVSLEPADGDAQKEPLSTQNPRGVLIFTKSNETAVRLGRLVSLLEPTCADSIGMLTSTTRSSARKATLKSFESGKLSILVASDLVSRGLDLPNLAHVINYDIPTSLTSYVHRVGRTARAGKRGHAWTLFTGSEGRWFWNEIGRSESIERSNGSKIERITMNTSVFDGVQRQKYENALEALGQEASSHKSQRPNHK